MSESRKSKNKDRDFVIHIILLIVIIAGFTAGYIWIPVITIIIETIFWIAVSLSYPFDDVK